MGYFPIRSLFMDRRSLDVKFNSKGFDEVGVGGTDGAAPEPIERVATAADAFGEVFQIIAADLLESLTDAFGESWLGGHGAHLKGARIYSGFSREWSREETRNSS